MCLPSTVQDQWNPVYVLDCDYRIVAVNAGYRQACSGHDPEEFLATWGVGCAVMSVIPADLQPFYQELFARAFAGDVVEHRYQCHLPTRRREFIMRAMLNPGGGGVLVEHALAFEGPLNDGIIMDESGIRRDYLREGFILQCAHCRKVRMNSSEEVWNWVIPLIARPWPNTSHGLCPVCFEYYYPESLPAQKT